VLIPAMTSVLTPRVRRSASSAVP